MVPFFNVFKEGMKADCELASGSYGHTRTRAYEKGPTDGKAKRRHGTGLALRPVGGGYTPRPTASWLCSRD